MTRSRCVASEKNGLRVNLKIETIHTPVSALLNRAEGPSSQNVVKDCQYFSGVVLPSVLVLRKADKSALRYQCLENAFCTYCRSI